MVWDSKQERCRLHCWLENASWTRWCHGRSLLKCRLLRPWHLWILLSRRQNPLLRPVVTINVKIKADGMVLSLRWGCREHFVSGCWHSSGRDRGRYPRECWLSTLGVLHPGVLVMWYGHIRDLFPAAKGCMGSRLPNVTMLHWAQQE